MSEQETPTQEATTMDRTATTDQRFTCEGCNSTYAFGQLPDDTRHYLIEAHADAATCPRCWGDLFEEVPA
jgi:hypothetical protein